MFRIQLKKLREQKGYKTQAAFAKKLGVSQSTVGNWESGTREPPYDTLIKIATLFEVSVDDLLGIAKPSKPNLFCEAPGYWDGSLLAGERKAREYSSKYMADALEMTETEYLGLESSKYAPSFDTLLLLADLFAFDLDYLCHRTMKLESAPFVPHGTENLLLKKYRSLDTRGRDNVWNTLNHEYESQLGEKAKATPKEA